MVVVDYMDPGNWAASIAGGSKFGYTLLVVALVSNLMAIVLQSLCARIAIASGLDRAQTCRDAFRSMVAIPLWILAELAIIATDIAEVIGTAIGLNLLFGIPLEIGVVITALDVFLILWLQNRGFRWLEAFIITLLGMIAVCFGLQIAPADSDWGGVIRSFAPPLKSCAIQKCCVWCLAFWGPRLCRITCICIPPSSKPATTAIACPKSARR